MFEYRMSGLDEEGIEPPASRMRSERSTPELHARSSHRESNPRPFAYEANALPLSYVSAVREGSRTLDSSV